ncbi:serine hydrolase [uncultured Paraglaciecola sp.]|uniref:serine hydrolase domain-containing protein n=1 Tax=uncultured Paraglaciecola sp. TaxID=1765024 RepID=UPI00260BF341|nr:serine hydrolase domain-containing protein [uncultured Paraglaciecola sp.]
MLKAVIWALLFLSLFSQHLNAADKWLDSFSKDVQRKARKKNLPGYTFAYIEKGKAASVFTYGKESKSGNPIEIDTVFRLASVSKTFTSMLMAKYVGQNQLNWQMPVAQLVPEFASATGQTGNLELQHVIGQSSGYIPNAYDNLIEANYSVSRVLSMLSDLKPLCKPGQCYTYQNTLFAVVDGYFKQHHSSYSQALTQTIIEPLKMPHASVGKAGLQASNKWAKPHVAISKNRWRTTKVRDDYYRYSPAAGVNASMRDMVIWMRALLGETPDIVSNELISEVTTALTKSKKEVYRRQWRKFLLNAHYGLGWRIYDFAGHTLNYHGGWVQGYRADIAFSPEFGVGYVMLMNAESNLINEFTPDFWARCFKHLEQRAMLAGKPAS